MPEGSIDNLCFRKALNTKKLYSSLSLALVQITIKVSNYQAKIKHVEEMLLREITLNFIVIGQRHYGRVTVIPPRDKKVPEGVDMLAFYKQMLQGLL